MTILASFTYSKNIFQGATVVIFEINNVRDVDVVIG
jgi:hypothetical protein